MQRVLKDAICKMHARKIVDQCHVNGRVSGWNNFARQIESAGRWSFRLTTRTTSGHAGVSRLGKPILRKGLGIDTKLLVHASQPSTPSWSTMCHLRSRRLPRQSSRRSPGDFRPDGSCRSGSQAPVNSGKSGTPPDPRQGLPPTSSTCKPSAAEVAV